MTEIRPVFTRVQVRWAPNAYSSPEDVIRLPVLQRLWIVAAAKSQ